jgi:hypothetical protein
MSRIFESTAQVLIEPGLDSPTGRALTRQPRSISDFRRFCFSINRHHREGQLTRVSEGTPAPASDDPMITVIKVDTAVRAARLRDRLHHLKSLYGDLIVVMNCTEFNRPDIRSVLTAEHGVEVVVEDSHHFQLNLLHPWIAQLVANRNAAVHSQSAPALPQSPADTLDLSARLRDPATGRLDANLISDLLGISRADIARLCGVSKQSLNQTPASSGIQAKLQPLEDVAQALLWCGGSEAKLRAWLNRPNRDFPEVDGKKPSPINLIIGGHAELVAQKVHNLRTGQPS